MSHCPTIRQGKMQISLHFPDTVLQVLGGIYTAEALPILYSLYYTFAGYKAGQDKVLSLKRLYIFTIGNMSREPQVEPIWVVIPLYPICNDRRE